MKSANRFLMMFLIIVIFSSIIPVAASTESGIEITCVDGDLLVSGSFIATENIGELYNVYLATYEDDGTLLKVDMSESFTVFDGVNTINFTAENIRNVQHTRAFVWTKRGMNDLCAPAEKTIRTLKILGIGNSFTQDAMEWLYKIADNNGIDHIVLGYGYRGGCSLQSHWDAASGDKAVYRYYQNTNDAWSYTDSVKLSTILKDDDWNLIVLQQVSQDSGRISTFEPYIGYLIDYVNERKTNKYAQFAWQMTWAYSEDSTHSGYANYDNDQMTMYNAIAEAGKYVEALNKFDMIFPVGTVIQNARTSYIPDSKFTRDGYHLSTIFGRYIAGLTWFKTIFDYPVKDVFWIPSTTSVPEDYFNIIKEAIDNACVNPYKLTLSKYESNLTSDYKAYLDKYDILEWEPLEFSFYESTKKSEPYTPGNSTSSLLKYYICTPVFTREDIPEGSIIIVENYYQYRPEGWVELSKAAAARGEETSTKLVKVTSDWWGNDNYKAFNICRLGRSEVLTGKVDEAMASFHILIPKEGMDSSDAVVVPGAVAAVADAWLKGSTGASGTGGVAPTHAGAGTENSVGHQFMIQDERAGYSGTAVLRFDISAVDMDASEILLKIGTSCKASGMLTIVTDEEFKLTVRKVENATQNWEDTTEGFSGYNTITGGARKNSLFSSDVYKNDASIIATVTDYELQGTIKGFNNTTSSTGYMFIYADITDYVKAEKAKGNGSVTVAVKGDAIGSTIWTYTRTYTSSVYPNSKTFLTWK